MKTELKAKFLQHILNKKNENEGFTLIELLVVIIIIGILSAIALPSFLNQANKAKQSEAKTYTGSMNRAQQAFYLEQNAFAAQADFGKLGLGVATQTTNYIYKIDGGGASASIVTNQAKTVIDNAPLKSYVGGVGIATQAATSEATTIAILCEANQARVNTGADVAAATYTANGPSCPANFTSLK
ncbi:MULTISPECIES: type IV pilin-like G/H family protein [unclassified Nostoc]|uniref:type IV pilin-like G/H family protein n=1 Tax=unclassified Nostoc TaxID=2593658 RepID=UPI002AD56F79|nr:MULTISPECIES: type IV pilin-like G/H family protein [unclassified Nostoc]MDZ8035342.1 type IV pilin-like G/H family protein [Nostoc sp. DedSLP04]MDZ8130485.1 type IV pilin-like G/H family protein [Nostoc sp. DedQUE07]